VALGAAGFVVFSALFPHEVSPTRVAAQVVSGIGFLGAGIIFRHGFTIHGLNTAATLWCSAAVGLMAGAGAPAFALLLTALVVFTNLGLRPVVKWIKNSTGAGMPVQLEYRVSLGCDAKAEAKVRALALRSFALPGFQVLGIEKTQPTDDAPLTLQITVVSEGTDETAIRQAVGPLLLDPKVTSVTWVSSTDG
jgi:putative Mg2+ transporter-C (MgtC) family protein